PSPTGASPYPGAGFLGDARVLLQAPHPPQEVRKAAECGVDALLLVPRARGIPAENAAGRQVAPHPRLRRDLGAVADRHVIRKAGLAGDDDAVSEGGAPRDPGLRDDQAVRPRPDVVRE